MPLLEIEEMPPVAGLPVPERFYTVTREPAPLAGMSLPNQDTPWQELHKAGFRHVVCLMTGRPYYQPSPLNPLHAAALQDLVGGRSPDDPVREIELIRESVELAVERLQKKEGVVVHCVGGTGRTGTVLGCILRRLGYAGPDIVGYLDRLNREGRSRHGWPEAKWQAAQVLDFPAVSPPPAA
jgi:protein-tyrosine phosphatase